MGSRTECSRATTFDFYDLERDGHTRVVASGMAAGVEIPAWPLSDVAVASSVGRLDLPLTGPGFSSNIRRV